MSPQMDHDWRDDWDEDLDEDLDEELEAEFGLRERRKDKLPPKKNKSNEWGKGPRSRHKHTWRRPKGGDDIN